MATFHLLSINGNAARGAPISSAAQFNRRQRSDSSRFASYLPKNPKQLAELTEHFASKRPVLYRGVAMLLAHHQFDKSLREDAAGIWLQEQRHQFNSGLRLLTLIGVISLYSVY